jgi:precorrin-4/cobalt-precorrin-4 C11-methyltransferase
MVEGNTVFFVGSGPGDPELITIKAKRLLEEADVVIYSGSLLNTICKERSAAVRCCSFR